MSVLLVMVLLAGCGQRAGVHPRFVQRFREVVAVSTHAHGSSARTRSSGPRRHVRLRPKHVPGGRRILVVHVSVTSSSITWPQWAALLLDRLNAPRCANNLIVVVAWAAQEGSSAGWNPLDTTQAMPGATLYNSVGVRNYVSLQQGLDATILTLQQGFKIHRYGAIVDDLRACAGPTVTAVAINASDWCRGCNGGAYVLETVTKVIASYDASLRSSS
jgi:hypothetical protein